MGSEKPYLLVITGPTATGKTGTSIEVAQALDGEVISADSMMVYRGMDIGTAKPDSAEMRGVLHHLIDVVNPDEAYSVATYQEAAETKIREIHVRNRLPILVGGTGLYVRAVLDHYDFVIGADPKLRQELQLAARIHGGAWLHERLVAVDPATAARLHPNDVRRVIRALEVFQHTGSPLSSFQSLQQVREPKFRALVIGLTCQREILYQRIEARVDQMMANGLEAEVCGLLKRGYARGLTSMKGLGYKEIAAYLNGESTLDEAVRLLKRNTRRFAKRQLTWFRGDERINWLDAGKATQESLAKEIIAKWQEYQVPERKYSAHI